MEVYKRYSDSLVQAAKGYADRRENGANTAMGQPEYANPAYGAGTDFLVAANVAYVGITLLLYLVMKRQVAGFQIKRIIAVYNLTCVVAAGYVVIELVTFKYRRLWTGHNKFSCNTLIEDSVEDRNHIAFVFWFFYAQKFWEFLDTWFFILRKSFRQVTFLHLFHHSSITIVVGSILPYDFNGDMFLPILLNSIVHVLMYLHYFVTAVGIKSWWRQYLTSLQLAQFILISTQSFLAYREGADCGAPDWAKLLMLGYMSSMLVLFGNFFLQRYVLSKPDANMCGVIKAVESPRHSQYNGMERLDQKGEATVYLPPWFSTAGHKGNLTHFSYQLTPVGATMGLFVCEEIDVAMGRFRIAGGDRRGR
jgi:elongation of very long chain fatty acids protein 4